MDAVSDLQIKGDDKYYIAYDYVVDNQDIRNKYRMLKSIEEKSEGRLRTFYRPLLVLRKFTNQ